MTGTALKEFSLYANAMDAPHKADPATYAMLRRHALETRLPRIPPRAIQTVIMDFHVDHGTATVVASVDGSASLYLSSGGGFLGGSQHYPSIRDAALHAVSLATTMQCHFEPTENSALPPLGDVTFYVTSGAGIRIAVASQARLRAAADPLAGLGGAMQKIVTEYRFHLPKRPPSPVPPPVESAHESPEPSAL
ncbi:MAG TPA: hypothetical protein VFE06_11840 [Acidobacteriaceae bacterium]|jgi:hypothetical protein|nr:hypothetical protein [Acidobacteriaceae bacterium]